MQFSTGALAVAAFLPAALAHYNFEALIVNGVVTDPYEYVRSPNISNSPITDLTSTDMRCNSGGLLAATMAATSTYTVAPGDNIGMTMNPGISHPGPLSVWMSKAPDGTAANAYDGSGVSPSHTRPHAHGIIPTNFVNIGLVQDLRAHHLRHHRRGSAVGHLHPRLQRYLQLDHRPPH